MHHGVTAGGDSSKARSDICCSDTYLVVSNLCKLCRKLSFILIILVSSFASVCIPDPEEEGICCGWSPVPGVSPFPCSCSPHSG